MPDALAVSAPASQPSPQKIDKSPVEKAECAAEGHDEGREFADVLEEAVELPPLEVAMIDPAAAIPATQLPVLAGENPSNSGGELGVGGMPQDGRHAATLLPLRPEARAALQAAMPEATMAAGTAANDARVNQQPETSLAEADVQAQPFDDLATPGKPFEAAIERAASATSSSHAAAEPAQPTTPPPTGADAAAEAARRERPIALKLETHLPVHSPRFADGFNQQVVVLAQHGIQQAQMSLSPPDLGPVDVRITMAHDEASVQIAAPSGIARDAIQDALPRLKEMMEQSGLRLNDASVFAQLPQREESNSAQQRGEGWRQQPGTGMTEADEAPMPLMIRHLGLIDAYA